MNGIVNTEYKKISNLSLLLKNIYEGNYKVKKKEKNK